MRNASDKSCRETQSTYFTFNNFSQNHVVYEIMWKNMVRRDGPQMAIQHVAWALHAEQQKPQIHTKDMKYSSFPMATKSTRTRSNVTFSYTHTACFVLRVIQLHKSLLNTAAYTMFRSPSSRLCVCSEKRD